MDEADGANIGVNDLKCMMLQIGVSDIALQHELGSIKNPTLPSFNEKIEGYKQARKTTSPSTAFGNAASKGNNNHRPAAGESKPSQHPGPARGRGERDHRLALRGRCFGYPKDDHLLPHCNYPENVKCNLCSATCHIMPACSRRQNVRSIQQLPASTPASQKLAIAYGGGSSFPETR